MKYETEITVKPNISLEELIEFLEKNDFKLVEEYSMTDIYYIKDLDLTKDSLSILKECVLVRDIKGSKFYLLKKYKEYDNRGNILKQGKCGVKVKSVKDASLFLEALDYKSLITIKDKMRVYEKDGLQICVQFVNDKYLFIEAESNEKYNSVEDLIEYMEKSNIDYDKSDYFVKKAKIIFEEKYKEKI